MSATDPPSPPSSTAKNTKNKNTNNPPPRYVWAHNLEYEFSVIRNIIPHFPYISMDTEFPGTIIPKNHHQRTPDSRYRILKSNVDVLHLIQVGLTLSSSSGTLPFTTQKQCFVWEFNFSDFDLSRDLHVKDSIELLHRHGINFELNKHHGIHSSNFAELLMSSGLLCDDSVTWVTFDGYYDFGYLIKILTGKPLPEDVNEFLVLLRVFFGNKFYDVKYVMKFCQNLHGGLEHVARMLHVERVVGRSHQAGSDSLLTWMVFQKIREVFFRGEDGYGNALIEKYAGLLYGFEV